MIGAVILAAGESRRMGEPKLLLEIKGKRMIEWIIESFRGTVDEFVVVLGHKPEHLIPILKKVKAQWVINENYREGMASSFKRGVQKLKHCDALFLVLGDQPFVARDFLVKAIDAWMGGAKVVGPVYRGKKGHPVLFDKILFDEILSLQKHEMIRDIIHRHEGGHHLVNAGEWATTDLDTPNGFRKILEKNFSR